VAAVDLNDSVPRVDLLHRWKNSPLRAADGTLRWNWSRIRSEVEKGLIQGLSSGPVASIGVDGWGVDYGLIGEDGSLMSTPFSYRDHRTAGWRAVVDSIGADRLYETTGVQPMRFNTLFQLAYHDPAELRRARMLLLLPDLLVHSLTGSTETELSNASTTGLLDITSGVWSLGVVDTIGIPRGILTELGTAGRPRGTWNGVPVTSVGSHDTASAFLGTPRLGEPGSIIISLGTWILVGTERERPDTSVAARQRGFSNERGAFGGIRFLKNIMGFWMLEQCRSEWGNPVASDLIAEAAQVDGSVPIVDATDDRFLAPESMVQEIVDAAGFDRQPSRAEIVRCIVESMAQSISRTVAEMGEQLNMPVERLCVVGGGVNVDLLSRLIVEHTGLPVVIGPSEASVLGNAIAQGIGIGRFDGLDIARRWVEPIGATFQPN
jgi:rhamnulokinase